jgi:hypothetical protein
MQRVYTTKTKSEIMSYMRINMDIGFIRDILLAKECGPTKVLNPKTKRCVSKNGSIGKKLDIDSFATSRKIWVKIILQEISLNEIKEIYKEKLGKFSPPKKRCRPDQILNPKTNRCVKKTSKIGKELLKSKPKSPKKATPPKPKSPKKATPPKAKSPRETCDKEIARIMKIGYQQKYYGDRTPIPPPQAYKILKIPVNTTDRKTVIKSYRKISLIIHPDKCGEPGSQLAFQKLNEARQVIMGRM